MIKHVTLPNLRLHLREVEDGAILWINGVNAIHLNNVASDYVAFWISAMKKYETAGVFPEKDVKSQIIRSMTRKYKVDKESAAKDFDALYSKITDIGINGQCPFEDVTQSTKSLDTIWETAPARADLALTYQCNDKCQFCYIGDRKIEELPIGAWQDIIDRLWKIGVPSLTFTGGEPTIRKDLPEIILHASEFITGLVTNGRNLTPELCLKLHHSELDYIQVSLESSDAGIHDKMVGVEEAFKETVAGIENALKAKILVTTNTTLTKLNADKFNDTIQFVADLGIKNIACNSLICSGAGCTMIRDSGLTENELKLILINAKNYAQTLGIELQWYTPTCYEKPNPIDLGFGIKNCSAAKYNVTIEPNGDVIPCQSWFDKKLGNILENDWKTIWNGEYAESIRKGKFVPQSCNNCTEIKICGGACNLPSR